MSFAEFAASVARDAAPPAELDPALRALWHDARGDWSTAHAHAQEADGDRGAWVHAYLHRKEGDAENAFYWYARAGRSRPADDVTLKDEWEQIARELLGDQAKA
jgi:hypothetical protein